PEPAKPNPAQPRLPPPPPKQAPPPTPPPPPPLRTVSPSDPYLYDFWKETYTNQDQTQRANPHARPTAIENMPAPERNVPPSNLRLGPPSSYHNAPGYLSG
ncbi:hypothetical protein EGW08_019184, partial [Elysia chlorotica]